MKTYNSRERKKYDRIYKLIETARSHFQDEDLMQVFSDITGNEYVEKKDTEEIISHLAIEGYCIFKPDSTMKAEQLREYAESNIFPYYNEQQTAILF